MDNFTIVFLKEANKNKSVKLSVFNATKEYTPGKVLDFINLLIETGAATLSKDRLIITTDEEKYKAFKREHISFIKTFSRGDILTHSLKINEIALRALAFIYKNPACTSVEISQKIGSVDLSVLGVLDRLQLIVSVDNEFFCTLNASDYGDLLKELKRRGITLPTEETQEKEVRVKVEIDFATLSLTGVADLNLNPASLIYYFYQNSNDFQTQKDMRRIGLHLTKYATVIDELQSYFRFVCNGKEYSLNFNQPILFQLENMGFDKISENSLLLFKALVKLKNVD